MQEPWIFRVGGTGQKAAINTLNRAVQAGEITRPLHCPKCGKRKRLDAHHVSYDRPLDVTWLCRGCHKRLHYRVEKVLSALVEFVDLSRNVAKPVA